MPEKVSDMHAITTGAGLHEAQACLLACLPACLPACQPVCPSVCLCVRPSVCLSVCVSASVCVSVCVSVACLPACKVCYCAGDATLHSGQRLPDRQYDIAYHHRNG